jgi:predicted DNA binding CopG/RHH family protein
MTKKEIAAEAAYASKAYKNRAAINREAQGVITAATQASRPLTIRLNVGQIELAKKQAEAKGLKYQTYIKMLLHQALTGEERAKRI